jgi:hypothetical protein
MRHLVPSAPYLALFGEVWTTLEEDYIAFLLRAPKSTNCNKQVFIA